MTGFDIPDNDVAFNAHQSIWMSTDIDILTAGLNGVGVLSGCAVTAQGTPDMTLAVAAGSIRVASGATVTVTSGNVTIGVADATSPRIDLVSVSDAGVKTVTAGTADSAPKPSALPSGHIALAMVYVPPTDTAIEGTQVIDKRVVLPGVLVPSGGIIMWSGQTTAIPAGWLLCDGTSGTPDLRDRFIVGADTTNENTSGGNVSASTALPNHATHANHGAHSTHGNHNEHGNHADHSTHGDHGDHQHVTTTGGGVDGNRYDRAGLYGTHGSVGGLIFYPATATAGASSLDLTSGRISGGSAHGGHEGHGAHAGHGSHDAHSAHDVHSGHDGHGIMKFYRLAYIMKT